MPVHISQGEGFFPAEKYSKLAIVSLASTRPLLQETHSCCYQHNQLNAYGHNMQW